jgi:group I intron endonuclease
MVFNIDHILKKCSGVYIITNTVDDRTYIGSAKKLWQRYRQHMSHLNSGRHCNIKLQRFASKYGIDKLKFSLIEACDISALIDREQFWLDNKGGALFNVTLTAGSNLGIKKTDEQKKAQSERKKGHKMPQVTRDAIRKAVIGNQWNVGKTTSEEQKKKTSEALKGRTPSNFSTLHSPESRAKARLKMIGKPKSEEAKAKYREIALNRAALKKKDFVNAYLKAI